MAAGIFPHTDYGTCLGISVSVAVLAALHFVLLKRLPHAMLTSVFALTALDFLVVYMAFGHVNIALTWFLVPLLSILFCDRRLYLYALISNYLFVIVAEYGTAQYYVDLGSPFETVQSYFLNTLAGYTIEMLFMAIAGYMIVKLSSSYFLGLFRQQEIIENQEKSERKRMKTLDSMVEIYDNANLISFVESTEMSLRDPNQEKHAIDMGVQTHTLMNQRIKGRVVPEQLESFLEFTNITTVQDRLKGRKIISADFVDVVSGWFRAQYITVEAASDGRPSVVIYTTRNVDDEKRREEHLVRLTMTDELTRLRNRRSLEEDMSALRADGLDDDLVMFCIDVNGLKRVNDTKGHAAGDELIKGAADCLLLTIGQVGNAYRTGGDEFMAIVHDKAPESIREAIWKRASAWQGAHSDKLSLAVGYASYADHPDATVDDLEHLADADMYAEKERYYRETGIDRRRR
ncbi:MAG: GGDEF domain-containing protein [Eggerthellaceae bacterium]|nr:GGDEF domain-containing protein [Eggerthellaceae bacterium]